MLDDLRVFNRNQLRLIVEVIRRRASLPHDLGNEAIRLPARDVGPVDKASLNALPIPLITASFDTTQGTNLKS
jgi:hypothetical protein